MTHAQEETTLTGDGILFSVVSSKSIKIDETI